MNTNLALALIKSTGGTTSRAFGDRFTDVINVRDYGADPTGGNTTATYNAFNDAIDAALTSGIGGYGSLYVPRGLYNIGSGHSIQLPPNRSGNNASFRIYGEGSSCTIIQGNVNGFILDTGGANVISGSHLIEGLTVINGNTTPYTSGCIRIGNAGNSIVRSCSGQGQVFVTFEYPPGTRLGQGLGKVENCYLTGDGTTTCIGVVASGDACYVTHCNFQGFNTAVCIAGNGCGVEWSHFETNTTGIACGVLGNGDPGSAAAMLIFGCTFEACGTMIDVIGASAGNIINCGGQCHTSPSIGGVANATSKYGLRLRDNKFNLLTIDGFAATGTVDNALISIGTAAGRPLNKFKGLFAFSNSGSTLFELPGSATGGAAAAGAAACGNFELCTIAPVWKYADLPWDTLSSAQITGVSLIYSSASRGLGPMLGGLVTGVGVTAGTVIETNGTTFFGATLDDGSAGAGTILNFTSVSGVPPVAGAIITGSTSEISTYNVTIDDGLGGVGHNLTIASAAITSATISDGLGGSGNQLTFTNSNVSGALTSALLAGVQPLAGLIVSGSGISADTHVIAGSIGATTTTLTLNKSYSFSGTVTVVPDLRVGYQLNDDNNSGASHSWVVATKVDATHFTLSGASDQLFTGAGFIWIKTVGTAVLTTQNSATSWNVSGSSQNIGYSGGFRAENTWSVNNSQTVGPITMTTYQCLIDDEYTIGDCPVVAIGDPVTVGGSTHKARLRVDGETGFIRV